MQKYLQTYVCKTYSTSQEQIHLKVNLSTNNNHINDPRNQQNLKGFYLKHWSSNLSWTDNIMLIIFQDSSSCAPNVPKLKGISLFFSSFLFAISSRTGNSLCYHFSPLEQKLSILLNLGEKIGMLLNKKGMFYQYFFGEGLRSTVEKNWPKRPPI